MSFDVTPGCRSLRLIRRTVHFYISLNRTGEQMLTDEVKSCATVNAAVVSRKRHLVQHHFSNSFFAKFLNTGNKQVPYHNTGEIQDNIVYVKTSADYWLYYLDDNRDYYCDF